MIKVKKTLLNEFFDCEARKTKQLKMNLLNECFSPLVPLHFILYRLDFIL